MRYPPEAFRYSLDGTVRLEFVVEPSGTLSNLHAIEDVGGGCTDEAMRLVQKIQWLPGQKAGQRVRSILQVSIRFDLPKEAR
jgi:protein TonB